MNDASLRRSVRPLPNSLVPFRRSRLLETLGTEQSGLQSRLGSAQVASLRQLGSQPAA